MAAEEGAVQLKHLESLVSEAARIPVSLPDAKVSPFSLFIMHFILTDTGHTQWPEQGLRTRLA